MKKREIIILINSLDRKIIRYTEKLTLIYVCIIIIKITEFEIKNFIKRIAKFKVKTNK